MIVYDVIQKKYVIIVKSNNQTYYQDIINLKYGKFCNRDKVDISKMIYDKINITY